MSRKTGGRKPGDRRPGGRRSGSRRAEGREPEPWETSGRPARPPAGARLAELEELEVTVEKLVAGGDGLARFEGIPIFVPRSAPGDRLRVQLTERRPDYGRAEIVEILEPGPGRREPPCPYFVDCGGCDLQHLDDRLQPRLKAEAVLETLVRLGGLEVPDDLRVITGDPWGYRLRAQFQIGRRALDGDDASQPSGGAKYGLAVGYHRRGSHDVVHVERCPILVPELERILQRIPEVLGRIEGHTPRRLDAAAGEAESGGVTVAPVVEGLPHGEVVLQARGLRYAYDGRSFFQAHRELVDQLIEAVAGESLAEVMGDGAGEGTAYDLYAGVGLFALPLARRYRRVVAVEGDPVAARFCRKNAKSNRLAHVEVVTQALETWIPKLPEGAARAVVDPPRAGLHRKVRQALFRHGPRWLTYVSCHPATLARDLRQLGNRYELKSLTLLDLFPQTGHMEAVAQLRRLVDLG